MQGRRRGVVQWRGEGAAALGDDAREQAPLSPAHIRHQAAEALHLAAAAAEAHDYEVGRDAHGGQGVELPRRVEDELTLAELAHALPGRDAQQAAVYVQQLPKVVLLSLEGVARGVFKIVYGV